jgi:hypothetical protein
MDDAAFERARCMFHQDVVSAAEDVVRMGRIGEMLLGERWLSAGAGERA